MAGIDKIYGSNEQYNEFYKWIKDNNNKLLASFYPRDDYESDYRPITNFSEEDDKWLLKYCKIKWVIDRIKEQYNI